MRLQDFRYEFKYVPVAELAEAATASQELFGIRVSSRGSLQLAGIGVLEFLHPVMCYTSGGILRVFSGFKRVQALQLSNTSTGAASHSETIAVVFHVHEESENVVEFFKSIRAMDNIFANGNYVRCNIVAHWAETVHSLKTVCPTMLTATEICRFAGQKKSTKFWRSIKMLVTAIENNPDGFRRFLERLKTDEVLANRPLDDLPTLDLVFAQSAASSSSTPLQENPSGPVVPEKDGSEQNEDLVEDGSAGDDADVIKAERVSAKRKLDRLQQSIRFGRESVSEAIEVLLKAKDKGHQAVTISCAIGMMETLSSLFNGILAGEDVTSASLMLMIQQDLNAASRRNQELRARVKESEERRRKIVGSSSSSKVEEPATKKPRVVSNDVSVLKDSTNVLARYQALQKENIVKKV